MVRVASLKAQVEAGIRKKSIDGQTPKEPVSYTHLTLPTTPYV